ncbi:uncharacterized protein BX664DRAFT_388659, partial [Halteromyces radiatus]|uniref:uncharacterized protein n=1 Tax=Halteromyces radiatus TaxID=101107 RepID=UPI00221FD1DB
MKPSIPIVSNNLSQDALSWYIVGSYLGGATEGRIAAMTGLSRQRIQYTITTFRKTGLPHRRKQTMDKRMKRTNTNDVSDTDSQSSSDEQSDTDDNTDMKIKKEEPNDDQIEWKNSMLHRRKNRLDATFTIDNVLSNCRKYEEKRILRWQQSLKAEGSMIFSQSSSSTSSVPKSSFSSTSSSINSNALSPVYHQHRQQHRQSQNRRRFNVWTQRDDKRLLRHVFMRVGSWDEVETLFDGRHSVTDCIKRWDVLHHYLFKELQKTGTSNW